MTQSDSPQATLKSLVDLAMYMPPARRSEDSALASELMTRSSLSEADRKTLSAVVIAYARSLPFALLDEQQSAAFAEALSWAAAEVSAEDRQALRQAAAALEYEPLRQRTVARLETLTTAGVTTGGASDRPTTTDTEPRPAEPAPIAPAFLPGRDKVDQTRLPVARALLSIVGFATPEKVEENRRTVVDLLEQQPSIDAEQWGSLAFMAGVYARNFPVPEMTRIQLRRLWDAIRWAVWYEHWFRSKNLSGRINQLVSLLQRLPPAEAADFVEQTGPELRTIVEMAKARALVDITDYLDAAGFDGPQATVLLAEARRQRAATGATVPRQATGPGHVATPVAPASVPGHFRDLLAVRLSRQEAATAMEQVWDYLDPQHEEANRSRLQRARQGDTRLLIELISHACQSAEWRLRSRRTTIGEDDLRTLCQLAMFAAGANDRVQGVLRILDLYGVYLLRSGTLGVEGYAQLVATATEEVAEGRDRVVQKAVDEAIQQVNALQAGAEADLLHAWVSAAGQWASQVDKESLTQLVTAMERQGVEESVDLLLLRKAIAPEDADDDGLSFLSAAERAAFDEHYRKARVYEIADLLAKHEASILETLSRSLAAGSFNEYRPPTKGVRLPGRQNMFLELKRKALSGNVADAREAHDSFKRAMAGRKEWERKTLREWRVYAAMQVDVFDAIPEWLEAFNSKNASLEEQWNLSVFHAGQREYAKALTFLQPSVSAARSSYEYLVFACYLAVQVIIRDATSADAERAREFLIANARNVLAPEAQLLWIVLANRRREDTEVMEFSDAIRAHRTLWDSPLTLPPPSLSNYPADFTARATKLEPLKAELKRLKMTRTWRLWLNDVLAIPANERWFQVWDWAATVCEEEGDINAAVSVLRKLARSSLREYNFPRGENDEAKRIFREKRVRFLARILVRLCELAKKHDRDNLLQEIAEEFVKPVGELLEAKNQNRVLHGYLQGMLPTTPSSGRTDGGTILASSSGPDAVWGQLGFVLAKVTEVGDLDQNLRTRIENAIDIYPGTAPRGRTVAEQLHGAVEAIWNLSATGGTAEEMPEMLDALAASLDATERDIERYELTSVRILVSMMKVVVRSFAEESCSPPVPSVTLNPGWLGFPSDTESSSVVVDVAFAGPGVARNLTAWVGWDGEAGATFGSVALGELAPGDAQCLSLPARRTADELPGSVSARVNLQYDWNFMNRVQRELVVSVPISDFAGYLAAHDINTQEFPDPFVVDGPLTRSDVQTNLFQGRVREIEEVRRAFGAPQLPNAPLCFYGIRRTGKTSLLRRIDTELDRMGLIPVEVSLNGIVASALTQEQVFGGFFTYVTRAVKQRYPDVDFNPDTPADHTNPLMLVDGFFTSLAAAFGDSGRVVLLLDEFQVLIADAGEPLLDSLRPVCEAGVVGMIVFANQGQDIMINMPGQLALQSRRVDFLSESETADAVRAPLDALGVVAPESTLRCMYEYTAGHPNFTMKLAKNGLAALNTEHRNVLSRNDIEEAAKDVLRSPGPFTTSWFSNKNLNSAEEDTAIKFAKIGDVGAGLAIDDEQLRQFDDEVLRNLDNKRVLQATAGRIKVRGRLLEEYLRALIGGMAPPPPSVGVTERVGLFIDLENVIRHIPPGVSIHDAGLALQRYAAKFGEVKVRYAVAAPWNVQDWHQVKLGLESSGIRVSEVSRRLLERGASKANAADMYLNDQINEEVDDKELATIVVATGDKDFLGMIEKYLDRGVQVQILGGNQGSTARLYTDLAQERRRNAYALGRLESDFDVAFIEDLFPPGGAS